MIAMFFAALPVEAKENLARIFLIYLMTSRYCNTRSIFYFQHVTHYFIFSRLRNNFFVYYF